MASIPMASMPNVGHGVRERTRLTGPYTAMREAAIGSGGAGFLHSDIATEGVAVRMSLAGNRQSTDASTASMTTSARGGTEEQLAEERMQSSMLREEVVRLAARARTAEAQRDAAALTPLYTAKKAEERAARAEAKLASVEAELERERARSAFLVSENERLASNARDVQAQQEQAAASLERARDECQEIKEKYVEISEARLAARIAAPTRGDETRMYVATETTACDSTLSEEGSSVRLCGPAAVKTLLMEQQKLVSADSMPPMPPPLPVVNTGPMASVGEVSHVPHTLASSYLLRPHDKAFVL